jgi:UDP-N-acetylmuramoylalanine--D-glutamate ligase
VRPPLPRGPYLVVGLARSGIAAARVLRERGELVIGYDDAPLGPAVEQLRRSGVELHAGGGGVELAERAGCLVKSPGVPREAPVVAAALARGVTVVGELELGWRLLPQQLVAVTGTNGKTTTVELVAAIHRAAGLAVETAGNVGRALCELALAPLDPATTIICEASSFQLEDALELAPDAAVLLNLTEDHLDRHHTLHRYKEAKLRIFERQSAAAVAVLPDDLPLERGGARRVLFGRSEQAALRLRGEVLHWQGEPLLAISELGARGPVENSMAAAAVTLARGVPAAAVGAGLRTFKGVAHRLEQVTTRAGVLYVNDSKATNVASTLVALGAFAPASVRLILGGQGKGQDFAALREAVAAKAVHSYVIGEDAPRIARALAGLPLSRAVTLERAVELARSSARPGETILLSPACASFDQFKDFEARGEAFKALIAQRDR